VSGGDLVWLVDPRRGRQLGRGGRLADEPLRVSLVGRVEHIGPGGVQLCGVAVVECGRGHQSDPGVTARVVVPVNERAAVLAGMVDRVEPGGNAGRYFRVLKFASE
jgi:hypothetical protein